MFSLLQIITLKIALVYVNKIFQRITLLMFFVYLILFSGFVEWSKPKVLGTPPLPRRSEFYHSAPLLFTMITELKCQNKMLDSNSEKNNYFSNTEVALCLDEYILKTCGQIHV